MSSAAFNLLQVVLIFISILVIIKLWRTGLYKRYRALLAFLIFVAIYWPGALFFSQNYRSQAYKTYWEISQPLTWFFSVWVVLELYSLILERHKGLATLGRWVQYAGFTVSVLVSFLTLLPKIKTGGVRANAIALYYYPIERGVDCGMLIFLLFLLLWLTQYPVPLSRNVVVHSFVYTILFLTNSLGVFAQMFFGVEPSPLLTFALNALFGLGILAWLVFLTPKGEEARMTVPRFSQEHEARVLDQLEMLNRTLLKISKK
jgi:hypothetical protein